MCVCAISRFSVKFDQFLALVSILLLSGGNNFNHITKTHPCNIENFFSCKNCKFRDNFNILVKNIDC